MLVFYRKIYINLLPGYGNFRNKTKVSFPFLYPYKKFIIPTTKISSSSENV